MRDAKSNSLVKGLVRIHLVITRALDVARERSHAHAGGLREDSVEARGFIDYVQTLVSVLHGHHAGEDEVAFPALRDRFPHMPWTRLGEDHVVVSRLLAQLSREVEALAVDQSSEGWSRAAALLDRIAESWAPHHRLEEDLMVPATIAPIVSDDEQDALVQKLAAHAQEHTGPDYLVLPFLLYNLDGEERRAMAELFPRAVTEQLVPMVWRAKWAPMKPFLLP